MNKLTIIASVLGVFALAPASLAQTQINNYPGITEEKAPESLEGNSDNQASKTESFSFAFDNAFDYSSCLDVILLA